MTVEWNIYLPVLYLYSLFVCCPSFSSGLIFMLKQWNVHPPITCTYHFACLFVCFLLSFGFVSLCVCVCVQIYYNFIYLGNFRRSKFKYDDRT